MGAFNFDLADLANPAPVRTSVALPPVISARVPEALAPSSSEGEEDSGVVTRPTRSKKRKLPYRADVVLEGQRYKGKRVSRGEADLDTEALGILDGAHKRTDDSGGEGSSSEESIGSELSALRDDIESDDGDLKKLEASGDNEHVPSRREERLKAEERVVAFRLAQVEKREMKRARAVQKQKDLNDAIVDMRIRIEPLVSSARRFPSFDDRKRSECWSSAESKVAVDESHSVLSSLARRTAETWLGYWPSGKRNSSDEDFERWRDTILDRWGTKVNEASGEVPKGGFKTIDTTVSAQMKASLASGKHLTRTRRVKETIALVGEGLEMPQGSNAIQFDDSEFYRTLLREIIESGAGPGGGLRYAQLSKGGTVKKKRDRSLAKGRRIKYDIHDKLVGFLAPVPLPDPGPLDEIVAALFGARGTVNAMK